LDFQKYNIEEKKKKKKKKEKATRIIFKNQQQPRKDYIFAFKNRVFFFF
jgi:hypothetical protein